MKIKFDKSDELTALLELEIEPSDYQKDFEEELKKYRAKAQMKGFRKGKTPLGFIKKMYGKSVLAEKINSKLQESIYDYLKEQNIDILGDPLPNEGQEQLEFDEKNLKSYTFKFDLGISPAFDVVGADDKATYEKTKVTITDDMIQDEVESYRKRAGEQKPTDTTIEENDLVKIQAEELDGDNPKQDGWASEFVISVDLAEEDIKSTLLKLKNGDEFTFDINNLEKNRDEEYVRKYFLQVGEDDEDKDIGNMFKGKIIEVKRLELAEVNQAFFDKLFGEGEVKSKDELKAKIKKNLQGYFDKQSTSLMYREIMDRLVADNNIDLPEPFLKRWLKVTNEGTDEAKIEEEFSGFVDNLKWTLIKSKLSKELGVEVDPEELQAFLTEKVRGYFGNYGYAGADDSMIQQMVTNLSQDKQQVQSAYNEIEANKLFAAIGEKIQIAEKAISSDDFTRMVKSANDKYQQVN